jgi:hypothetical protein
MEEETSNWRKLVNRAAFVKDLFESSEYDRFKLFIFTDISTAENAFRKGIVI